MKILILLFFMMATALGATSSIKADHVQVRLLTPQKSVGSDGNLKLAVHFELEPEWHVYWKNPGDSGAAPKFNIESGEIVEVHWPYPQRIPVKDLTNYGYEKEVTFPIDVKVAADTQEVKLNLEWLVCKVECIPGFADLALPLTRSESSEFKPEDDADVKLLANAFEKIPQTSEDLQIKIAEKTNEHWKLEVVSKSALKIEEIGEFFIYPENGEAFLTKSPNIQKENGSLKAEVPISTNNKPQETENFLFVAQLQSGKTLAFNQKLELQVESQGLLMGLVLAFLGGLILNLMPCVFPVLSLKIFGFLKEPDQAKIRKSSWAYSIGAVFTFTLIGAILAVLRSLGESVGWGYQLQNPWLIYLLSLLFFAMALNFFGFFEMGNNLMAMGGRVGKKGFLSGDFGTGVLAVVVASPCTAPFMGSALGLTLLLPAYQSLLIFSFLGVGMAAPMLLLAYWPKLISKLPRSGAWMVTLKQFMTFPLLLTCLWLLWVLHQQRGPEAVFLSLLSFTVLTMIIWMIQISKTKIWKLVLLVVLILNPLVSVYGIQKLQMYKAVENVETTWAAFDPAFVAEKRKSEIVFVDFTASWCISCQVNKKAVLETAEIEALFKKHNVFLVRADWTNLNPVITQALEELGRNSIPLYVVYNKSDKPILFPEVLTKDMLIHYFEEGVVP